MAYLFVPWLRGGTKGEGHIDASIKNAIGALEETVGNPRGTVDEGLKKARSWLREVPLPDPASVPGFRGTDQPHRGTEP